MILGLCTLLTVQKCVSTRMTVFQNNDDDIGGHVDVDDGAGAREVVEISIRGFCNSLTMEGCVNTRVFCDGIIEMVKVSNSEMVRCQSLPARALFSSRVLYMESRSKEPYNARSWTICRFVSVAVKVKGMRKDFS